jgi:membrane protein YqaA with SNARE-associated domain
MTRFIARTQAVALALGAPGLFLVAFVDSSILSLPEIADMLVIWMVTTHKARLVFYALSATLGSVAGCLVLYYLGRKGGDAFVRKRFSGASVNRTLATFQRYGVMAVLIPAVLPPPAPFKIFVLLAGIADISAGKFITAVAVGRGARYFVEGLLAVRYGDQAIGFVNEHSTMTSLIVVGILAAAFGAYLACTRAERRDRPIDRV